MCSEHSSALPDRIYLSGMMGAGKSTVGRQLAARVGYDFVDLDEEIWRRTGETAAAIFEQQGEQGFRRLEREALERLGEAQLVVALGGGTVTAPGVCGLVRGRGVLVHLSARPEELALRLGGAEGRPLLAGAWGRKALVARLAALLEERRGAYSERDLEVDTGGLRPDRIVERIVAWLSTGR